MLRLVLIFLLIFMLGSIQAASLNKREVDGLHLLEEYFEKKCAKNADSAAFMQLMLNVHNIQTAIRRKDAAGIGVNHCNSAYTYKQLDSIMTALEPCLEAEEKYLPDFALTTYNNSRDDICKNDDFIAMLDDLKNTQCEDAKQNIPMIGHNCLHDIIDTNFDFNSNTSLTKNHVCGQIEARRDCLIDGMKRVCSDDVFTNIIMWGFKAYSDWCENH